MGHHPEKMPLVDVELSHAIGGQIIAIEKRVDAEIIP